MEKLKTFLRMRVKHKLWFVVTIILCGLAKMLIYLFGYKRLMPYLGYGYKMLTASIIITNEQIQQALAIQRAVRLAARYSPWKSTCLTQAIVAILWCRYHQLPYLCFVGFSNTFNTSLLEAEGHAWVSAGPIPITGGYCFDTYRVIHTFSNYQLS